MGFFDALKKGINTNKANQQNAEVTNVILQECIQRYDVLTAQCNLVYQIALSQEEKNKHPFPKIMEDVDAYLQSILLGLALSDKTVSNDEIYIINKITKYGNLFKSANIDVEKTDFNGFVMKQRIQSVAQACHKMIPGIFNVIAEIDKRTGSDKFYEVAPTFIELLCFFCGTDKTISPAEKNKIRELTAPLFRLFPNTKAKL